MERYLYYFVLLSLPSRADQLWRFTIVIEFAIILFQRSRPLPWFLVGNACMAAAEADRSIDEFQILARTRAGSKRPARPSKWTLISHIVTLSFPRTHDLPSSDLSFCVFVPRIFSSQSPIFARAPHCPRMLAVLCLLQRVSFR